MMMESAWQVSTEEPPSNNLAKSPSTPSHLNTTHISRGSHQRVALPFSGLTWGFYGPLQYWTNYCCRRGVLSLLSKPLVLRNIKRVSVSPYLERKCVMTNLGFGSSVICVVINDIGMPKAD